MGGILAFARRNGLAYWMYIDGEGRAGGAPGRRRSRASTSSCSTSGASTSSTTPPSSRWSTRSPTRAPPSIAALVDGLLARFTAAGRGGIGHGPARAPERRRPRLRGDDGRRARRDDLVLRGAARERDRRRRGQRRLRRQRRAGRRIRLPLGRGRRRQARTSPTSAQDSTLKLHLEPGKTATVKLEVRNAFGLVQTKDDAASLGRNAPMSSL